MGGRAGSARTTASGVPAAGTAAITSKQARAPAPPPAAVAAVLADRDASIARQQAAAAKNIQQRAAAQWQPVVSWATATAPVAGRAVAYRKGRDAAVGDVLPFGGASGARERYTVLSVTTMAGRADAVTSVKVVHEREGRPAYQRSITMGDWQRLRDKHARQYGTGTP